jgi:transcriptional regulator NrdR family protein
MTAFAVTCPECNTHSRNHKVILGRRSLDDDGIVRRHKCANCANRFWTFQADPVGVSKYRIKWSDRTRPPAVVPLDCGTVASG